MNRAKKYVFLWIVVLSTIVSVFAQDGVRYSGSQLADPYRHDGRLTPVVGVHNIQLLRACRDSVSARYNYGWTYNHQPMICYWKGQFYVHYLCDSISEHVPPSRTVIQTSKDGYKWTAPRILFPEYPVPDGFSKPDYVGCSHGLKAIMHQRVGFYVSSENRLLATGNYGIALHPKDDPNDGNGIGRVVREMKEDGSLGPIYFVYYNHDFNEGNTEYPFYTRSPDKVFVRACREMMNDPLYRMQMVEESDRNDSMLPLKTPYKAFCHYSLEDGRIVGLWKHALTSISSDGGKTWPNPVARASGFVNSNAKIWGQRLSDGTYATLYNPAEFRWPLALSLSHDGLDYSTLNLVHGIVPPIRYGGNYKSFGPQYVRGILPGNGTPPDGDLWATYSVGKEDIWVTHIPVPVRNRVTSHVDDDISDARTISELREWNIYSGMATPIDLVEGPDRDTWLSMSDEDPFGFAYAERMIPSTSFLHVEFDVLPKQAGQGLLQIEFADSHGTSCARIELIDSLVRAKGGARYGNCGTFENGKTLHIAVDLSVSNRNYTVWIDGKRKTTRMLFAPVESIERIIFRTGAVGTHPNLDTPADQHTDMLRAGERDSLSIYYIGHLKSRGNEYVPILLQGDSYASYFEKFDALYVHDIVNDVDQTSSLGNFSLITEIPLFECSDPTIEEIYYFRWWTLSKHLRQTPVGVAMTEFLVPRSYADKYNLISSALGHHIHESRWLRDSSLVNQIIRIWYRGNGGQRMERMTNFSSWTPFSVYQSYLVTGDSSFVTDLLPDMKKEYLWWEQTHRTPEGLYWQSDVQDAMEESISGGRRKQYLRPTISSYMFGNSEAISHICRLAGDGYEAHYYQAKADTLRTLVEEQLWSDRDSFFETKRGDSLASVREAIGYVPWYFGLPSNANKYGVAWRQVCDKEGFDAPFGLTTAERRHPQFRAYFRASCEWNGPIWPFATSQTLTALANFLNDNPDNPYVTDSVWFRHMRLYAQSHYFHGRPYIGEYLDEKTGYWLKGDQIRSRHYNHSTFNDLVITGIVGLRPLAGDSVIEVNPLLPDGEWDYFCLDNIRYHGHNLTIAWDKTGLKYGQGSGLFVWLDGRCIGHRPTLGRLLCDW